MVASKRSTASKLKGTEIPASKATKAPSSRKRKTTDSDSKRDQTKSKKPKAVTQTIKNQESEALNQPPAKTLTVLVFGDGENAELGLGPDQTESEAPTVNPFLDPKAPSKFHVVQLACGGMHTAALTADNKVVTWGVNDCGALGRDTAWDGGLRDMDSDTEDGDGELNPLESTPKQVPSKYFEAGVQFAQVAAGDNCTFALTTTGLLYGWGTFLNTKGDKLFGFDDKDKPIEIQHFPVRIPGVQGIKQIACGTNHVLALDKAGIIWGWGCNDELQLGRHLFKHHQNSYVPHQLRISRGKIEYIASGECHSFAVDKSSNVWAWGRNSNCEAGHDPRGERPTSLPYPMKIQRLARSNIVHLAGGANHSVAVSVDGRCFAWGRMDTGQLGVQFSAEQLVDEGLIQRSITNKPQICKRPTIISGIGSVTHVACGSDHTIFVDEQGDAYASGFNCDGQLGLGSSDDVDVAKRIVKSGVKDMRIAWAGAGGRFSVLGAE